MLNWVLACILSLILMIIADWTTYEMLIFACLFAIYLNTIRKY